MTIDSDISLGNLLSAATAVLTVLGAGWRISYQIKEMEFKLDMMWDQYCIDHGIVNKSKR